MIILSIDPGFDKVGYALFQKGPRRELTFLTSGLIKTHKSLSHEKRLLSVYEELGRITETHKPDLMVMEQLFFTKNQTTVMKVSQAQGVMLLLAAQRSIPVTMLTPLQIKQIITGYGSSDKKSVHKMLNLLMRTEISVQDDDESDAIACGLAYCYLNQSLLQ